MRSNKGFTLIEILVVVAILGAVAGIVIMNVLQFIGRGRCEGYCTEKHNVITACVAAVESGDDGQTGYVNYLVDGATGCKFSWTVSENCSGAYGESKSGSEFDYTECTQCSD